MKSSLKTAIADPATGTVVWSAGDDIKVFNDLGEASVLTLVSGAGTPNAVFEGEVFKGSGNVYHSVTPSSLGSSCQGNIITMTLPENQTFTSGSYDSDACVFVSSATFDDGALDFTFKPVVSLVRFGLRGEGSVTKLTLTDRTGKNLSGTFTVNMSEENPVAVSSDGGMSVSLNCDTPVPLKDGEDTDFYFTLPVGSLSGGFSLVVSTSDDKTFVIETEKGNTTVYGDLKYFTAVEVPIVPVHVTYYADVNPDYPEAHYTRQPFVCLDGGEVLFNWELERKKQIWFRPIIEVDGGGGAYRDMKYNEIVYNDIPYHKPHMYGGCVSDMSETKLTQVLISDARTDLTQDNSWFLKLPDQYGDYKLLASDHFFYFEPNPTMMNDGNVPKRITIQGRLIKTGEDARTVTLSPGMNVVCNYNTKMLDLNALKQLRSDLEIIVHDGKLNLNPLDVSVPNNIYPSLCFAIKSETAQTVVIPESCYFDIVW